MERVLRVLVVDDSAYVRKVVREMLSRSPFIEVVGTARDGIEALELVEELHPDVITLDLIMPRMDGVEFLQQQMARRPIPVVVVSIASESGEKVLDAFEAGAIEFLQKPTALATEKIYEISTELIEKVKAAAGASLLRLKRNDHPPVDHAADVPILPAGSQRVDVVVIGISTGGPQALKYLIPLLPADFSASLAMVLHMPVGYTAMYARKLDELSRLRVVEAGEGDLLQPGVALLAPAGRHLSFLKRSDGAVTAHLDARPLDVPHRPSVDVLFQSAANVFQERVLGVVMTGMGADGREGAAWIKAKGGLIFTEAEETCVVYGMPRAVVESGLSDRVVPLERMPQALMEVV